MKKEITLAGGCFWGVEKFLAQKSGVVETEVGYANGLTQNPTYEEVCGDNTGFAEVVRVVYDDSKLGLPALLDHFYEIIDPTVSNRQGPDVGSQYRTGVYYVNQNDKGIIANSLEQLQKSYAVKIATENLPLKNYYKAEEYHQKYLDKNPGGYCHIPEAKFRT